MIQKVGKHGGELKKITSKVNPPLSKIIILEATNRIPGDENVLEKPANVMDDALSKFGIPQADYSDFYLRGDVYLAKYLIIYDFPPPGFPTYGGWNTDYSMASFRWGRNDKKYGEITYAADMPVPGQQISSVPPFLITDDNYEFFSFSESTGVGAFPNVNYSQTEYRLVLDVFPVLLP